jgi:two-component system, OmpR family, phosphate regulon sensor histidine kinase PhoR
VPWNRSLLVRLLGPYLIALAAVVAALYAYSDRVVEQLYVDTLSQSMLGQARLVGALLPWDLRGEALDQRCAALGHALDTRVSVIAVDGTVIGDSDAPSANLENHRDRPEVRAALVDGDGQAIRTSSSVSRRLFYRAWRMQRGAEQRVIRLAVPMATIELAQQRIRAAMWGGCIIAAIVALWPAFVISRRLSTRLSDLAEFSNAVAEGRDPPPLTPAGTDTVSRLGSNLKAMASTLSTELAAAREEKGKLEAVLSGMVEGVLVIDRSGVIQLSNQRADWLFRVGTGENLVGQPLINVSRDPDLQDLVRAVMRGDTQRPLVREIMREGVGRENLQVTATPIADPTGVSRLFILVFHDITDLKRLEATRRDFVANVSHELRTPLTAIRGYAETLRAGAAGDPALLERFLGVIERHSERLGRLIDDLLTLSDLELGRTELQRSPMPLGPAVDAAVEVVRDKARRGAVEIQRDLPADLPPLYADADRIEQVLVNLIDNAVKYTPAGGRVTIQGGVAERPDNGGPPVPSRAHTPERWIEICIADTGVGVPKQDLPRLTERFYRVDKARSRELGGTGLGLAIVKHIVQAHAGTLRIESEVGRGTRVHIYLPAADAAGQEGGANAGAA